MSRDELQSSQPEAGILSRISREMVRTQKQFFGKGPTSTKTYMMDDLVLVAMRGGFTTAEETMLRFGQSDMVRAFRQIYENEMGDRLVAMIEDLTARKVLTYQSQVLFYPHVVFEIFVMDSSDGHGGGGANVDAAVSEVVSDQPD